MRLKFEIVVEGTDALKTKFDHTVLTNPKIGDSLVAAFSTSILLAFDIRAEDQFKIVSFFGNPIETPQAAETALPIEKQVETENNSRKNVEELFNLAY